MSRLTNKLLAEELFSRRVSFDRRRFLSQTSYGIGSLALGNLLGIQHASAGELKAVQPSRVLDKVRHFAPKAKRIVFLFMSGGPSQFETFDYKPRLREMFGEQLPDSVRKGQRLTGMSAQQTSLPIAPSFASFRQHGKSGTWVSDLLPHTAEVIDDLCLLRTVYTEQINHDPAITFFHTGHHLAGRPSMGAWLSYGLGSINEDLPSFIVLQTKNAGGQPLYARLWGNGFLPTKHQGVQFRSGKEPVLYLNNPDNYGHEDRRRMLDDLQNLNHLQHDLYGDPEIDSRIAQYEMAFKMQTSVPEISDLTDEPDYMFDLYGEDSREPGTYAANCILARKLLEKDVRFVQVYHRGWDHHSHLRRGMQHQCKATDRATAALIKDLKDRSLLEDTLVVWGGEFGRTVYSQGKLNQESFGRDHHPRCFSMWMAGAGVKPGYAHGTTDDFSYNITSDPVHVHDVNATIMHLFGIDHEDLTFKFQGRRYRLTDVHGHVVKGILS